MPYNSAPLGSSSQRISTADIGDEAMKRAIRTMLLMVGLVGTFIAAAVQQVPASDGGPLILCPPKSTNCQSTLPPQ